MPETQLVITARVLWGDGGGDQATRNCMVCLSRRFLMFRAPWWIFIPRVSKPTIKIASECFFSPSSFISTGKPVNQETCYGEDSAPRHYGSSPHNYWPESRGSGAYVQGTSKSIDHNPHHKPSLFMLNDHKYVVACLVIFVPLLM